jgi:Sulfotransferase family
MSTELASDPIIVYGAPRSGTTYVEAILNSHPGVFISHETRIFEWMHQALRLAEGEGLLLAHRDDFVEHLRAGFPDLIRDFYRTLAPDARYWGDKNPHYADHRVRGCLDMIAELFPGSHFIHIMRDGRDVVSSLLRKQEDGKPWVTFEEAHDTWKWSVDLGRNFGRRVTPDRYFEFRYEDLVADDPGVAKEIFGFLGIDFDQAVEDFCYAQHVERTPFQDPMRDLRRGAAVSDWPDTFTSEEQARSLELIGQDLVWYGYETEKSLAELRARSAAAQADAQLRTD